MSEEIKQTPEEKIRFMECQIRDLRTELSEAIRIRDVAIYRKEIAEWAVVGVVQSRIHIKFATTSADINNRADLTQFAEAAGRNAAMKLLYDAGLAFKAHAEMHEMRQHIHYMENHAGARGVQFTPWKDTELTADKNTSYWAWPYPKSFGGPTNKP